MGEKSNSESIEIIQLDKEYVEKLLNEQTAEIIKAFNKVDKGIYFLILFFSFFLHGRGGTCHSAGSSLTGRPRVFFTYINSVTI